MQQIVEVSIRYTVPGIGWCPCLATTEVEVPIAHYGPASDDGLAQDPAARARREAGDD
jgi:hypothetical protein